MNILVTGGAGFIGSHVVEALQDEHSVVIIDDLNDYYNPEFKRQNLAQLKPTAFYEVNIIDLEAVNEIFRKHQFDVIIHLAARAGVRPSIAEPELYAHINSLGTTHLLQLATKHDVKQFIFGSTSAVYGNSSPVPFREDTDVSQPISPYAASKRGAEMMLYTYSHLYDMKITVLRFFTVYGERGRPDMAPYLFTKAILDGETITKFGDGTTSRDYTYVGDIVQGVMAAIEHPFKYEIINIGNHTPTSLNDFIAAVEKAAGKKAIIKQIGMQPGDVQRTCASTEKAQSLLGYAPQTPLEEGLERFVRWYKDNRL